MVVDHPKEIEKNEDINNYIHTHIHIQTYTYTNTRF
jgi:hypothetical protein